MQINGRNYCERCRSICLQCPGNRNHEDWCRLNPKNVKQVLSKKKKINKKTKELEMLPEREWKDLSKLNISKINKNIYYDSKGNPFNQ